MIQDCTDLPAPPVPIGIHDHAAQRAWEAYSVELGIARYRAQQRTREGDQKALGDQAAGRDLAARLVPPLVDRLRTYQVGIALAVAETEVEEHDLTDAEFVLTTVPAETLAVVAVLAVLRGTNGDLPRVARGDALHNLKPGDIDANGTAQRIGHAIRCELEAAAWKEAERAAAKQRKASGLQPLVNLYALMRHRNAEVDRRVFRKWSKKAPLFKAADWPDALTIALGMNVLALLIDACPEYIEHFLGVVNGRKKRVLRFTETAQTFLTGCDAYRSTARPFFLPMICEPLDHAYPEPEPA